MGEEGNRSRRLKGEQKKRGLSTSKGIAILSKHKRGKEFVIA